MWSGGEVFGEIWSIYGGANLAPFGGVHDDGFRVRAVMGYGDYGTGEVAFADLLIGYHKELGPLTLKGLGGLTVSEHRPSGPYPKVAGTGYGGRGILEAWWNITDKAWVSADLSGAWLQMEYGNRLEYNGRLRLGWRLWPELSTGLEAGAVGTSLEGGAAGAPADIHDNWHDSWKRNVARIGGFLRYEWTSGEVSLSAGLAVVEGSEAGPDRAGREPGPFGTVTALTRF
jgi:hypothetical protein